MVVLDEDALGEVGTVVCAAADTHGVLLQGAQAGDRLAGIAQAAAGALQGADDGGGGGGDAAEVGEVVEGDSLGAEDGGERPLDGDDAVAGGEAVAVLLFGTPGEGGAGGGEDGAGDGEAGKDALCPGDDEAAASLVIGDEGGGGDVAVGAVLGEGALRQATEFGLVEGEFGRGHRQGSD